MSASQSSPTDPAASAAQEPDLGQCQRKRASGANGRVVRYTTIGIQTRRQVKGEDRNWMRVGCKPGQRYFYDIWVGAYTSFGLTVLTYDKRGSGSSTGRYPGEYPTEML